MRDTFTTATQRKAFGKATKLAALADPTRNNNEAERASALSKLIELCERHGFELAEFGIAPAASPASGEQPQPEAEATAKPKRARKPADAPKPATPADKRDAERERALANRQHIARHYAGPSAASHGARAPKLAEALARVAAPVQRAKSASARDESGLALALKHADKAGTFCPVSATFDLGVLSRLASLGHIAVAGERLALTKTGLSLARLVTKRAAA